MNKKLILFDYDGTIVDSARMIVKGAIEAFRMCGLPDHFINFMKENKLDFDLEKIEKDLERKFKYE